jgi:CheY-like chemotaxis protein
MLARAGYTPCAAADGTHALALAQDSADALVMIVSLDLPDTDGLHLITVAHRSGRHTGHHAYILVTEHPAQLSPTASVLLQELAIGLVTHAADSSALLDAVQMMSQRLQGVHRPDSRSHA